MITTSYKDNCQDCNFNGGKIRNKVRCSHPLKTFPGDMPLTFKVCPFLGKEPAIIPADKPMETHKENLRNIIIEPEPVKCFECFMWSESRGHCLYSENLTDRNGTCDKGKRK